MEIEITDIEKIREIDFESEENRESFNKIEKENDEIIQSTKVSEKNLPAQIATAERQRRTSDRSPPLDSRGRLI